MPRPGLRDLARPQCYSQLLQNRSPRPAPRSRASSLPQLPAGSPWLRVRFRNLIQRAAGHRWQLCRRLVRHGSCRRIRLAPRAGAGSSTRSRRRTGRADTGASTASGSRGPDVGNCARSAWCQATSSARSGAGSPRSRHASSRQHRRAASQSRSRGQPGAGDRTDGCSEITACQGWGAT